MTDKKVLLFVASGLSTRMGGFPKGLATVNGIPVIINAINNANKYYDDIYIICNYNTENHFKEVLMKYDYPAKLRPIITGKGDAESVLKSILIVRNEIADDYDCTFCWGDAFFVSEIPFQYIVAADLNEVPSLLVGCSIDTDPYAYFDVYSENGNFLIPKIKRSYFKKIAGPVPVGIHDQCIFRCNTKTYLSIVELYQKHLGYDGENYLNSFSFFN